MTEVPKTMKTAKISIFVCFVRSLQDLPCLNLVAASPPASTSALELSGLGRVASVRLGAAVGHTRSPAEVLVHLPSLEHTADQNAVAAGGRTKSKLIEGDDLTASSHNASPSSINATQAADCHLQAAVVKKTDVVGDGAHNCCYLSILALHELGELGNRDGRAVGPTHKKPLENNLVELRLCAAGEETVQLCAIQTVRNPSCDVSQPFPR
jgi:hypothetical protein